MNSHASLPGFKKLSIRKRLGIGVAIIVLPLLLITFSGYLLFQYALEMMDQMYENISYEFVPVVTLRQRVLRAVMPANDYLIHGNTNERDNFETLRRGVDESFAAVLLIRFSDPQKHTKMIEAHKLWQEAARLSNEILTINNPLRNAMGATKMEKLDGLVDQIHDQLELVSAPTISELRTRHEILHQMRNKISVIIIVFVLTVSLVVLIGSLLIRRWVITPLSELETGTQQLAEGHLDYRINVNSDDEISRVARSFNEMATSLKHDREILHDLSIHDTLTGLFNRREFERLLNLELLRSSRHGLEFAVLMVDIDFFKKINDSYGHPAGDVVLKNVAARIRESLRPSDVLARYGGEEFIIMLPQTGINGASVYGERLCAHVRSTPVDVTDTIQPVITVSAGITTFPADHDNPARLIDAADKALYAAKSSGRNCCVMYKDIA